MSLSWRSLAILLSVVAPVVEAQQQITPEAFLDFATGQTLSFSANTDGGIVGEEEFLSRDLSVWRDASGRCTYGQIVVAGPLVCFIYEDAPQPDNCWMPFQDEAGVLVMSRQTFEVQRATVIPDTSLGCPSVPLS